MNNKVKKQTIDWDGFCDVVHLAHKLSESASKGQEENPSGKANRVDAPDTRHGENQLIRPRGGSEQKRKRRS